MIDIHAHILPGIDDGAGSMKQALEMAAMAADSGVSVMVTTPHSAAFGSQNNLWGEEMIQAVKDFRNALEKAKIPLQVYPGMEIFGTMEVPAMLDDGLFIGLNGSDYPLVEFDFYDYEEQATLILEQIRELGKRPVVAHPERYKYIQDDPTILNYWVKMGCLLQVNKGSLLGRFGRQEELLAMALVERKFVHAVASDAHSPVMRTTWMKDVEQLLKTEFSAECAQLLLEEIPLKILRNEVVRVRRPDWF